VVVTTLTLQTRAITQKSDMPDATGAALREEDGPCGSCWCYPAEISRAGVT
jgi:hypothetical protein